MPPVPVFAHGARAAWMLKYRPIGGAGQCGWQNAEPQCTRCRGVCRGREWPQAASRSVGCDDQPAVPVIGRLLRGPKGSTLEARSTGLEAAVESGDQSPRTMNATYADRELLSNETDMNRMMNAETDRMR